MRVSVLSRDISNSRQDKMAAHNEDDFNMLFRLVKDKYNFKYDIKHEQTLVCKTILRNQHSLAVLPTGFGKSECYILPPLILDEVTLENLLIHFFIYEHPFI